MSKTLKLLLSLLNAIIQVLNEHDYNLFDYDNTEFYISKIEYVTSEDKIYFATCEEKGAKP